MREIAGPLIFAVGAFVLVKLALGIAPLNETAKLVLTAAAAAVIAGIFTRRVRARKGGGR